MMFLLALCVRCDLEAVPIWVSAMDWSFRTGIPAWYYPFAQESDQ